MFGTRGISELIIILAIVLIIFGAGKLPGIGENLSGTRPIVIELLDPKAKGHPPYPGLDIP